MLALGELREPCLHTSCAAQGAPLLAEEIPPWEAFDLYASTILVTYYEH